MTALTPSSSSEPLARYGVQLVHRMGRVLSEYTTDDGSEAMRAFFQHTRSRFGDEQGPGSYAALTDTQLQLCAGWVAEGRGCYSTRFHTEAGRELFLQIDAEQACTQEA